MDMEKRVLRAGDVVVYLDTHRERHNALVTVWHGANDGDTVADYRAKYNVADGVPCVNLLFIASDPAKKDQYGRQLEERQSSVSHGSKQTPPNLGNCFLWPDEA